MEVEVLGPGFDLEEGAGGAVEGDVVEVDVFVVLWGVGAELEGGDGDRADDAAVFDEDVADGGGFGAQGADAGAAFEGAVGDADVFYRGTSLSWSARGPLEPLRAMQSSSTR